MTTSPVTINVDPLEATNAALANLPTPEVELPFPDEPAPLDEAPSTQPAPEITEEPKLDWESADNLYKAKFDELSNTLQSYQPLFEQMEQAKQQQATAAIEEISSKIEKVSEESASPLTDADKTQIRTAIRGYLEYERQRPDIEQNRLAGAAINYASRLVGDSATVKDLKDTAGQLIKKYGNNLSGMDAYVAARIEQRDQIASETRQGVATKRIQSGVDAVVAAPAQSGALRTLADYERAIYKGVRLTEKQWANYQAVRKQDGLD